RHRRGSRRPAGWTDDAGLSRPAVQSRVHGHGVAAADAAEPELRRRQSGHLRQARLAHLAETRRIQDRSSAADAVALPRASDESRGVPSSSALERRLGPFDAAAIIVSNVIGGGILFTPPQVAMLVPDAALFMSTWIAGGALAFAGAMTYAELAALRPRAGGEYVYLREAFGEAAAFFTGWTSFVAGFSGAIATSAAVMVFYLGRFAPALGNSAPWLVVPLIPGVVIVTLSPQTI